MRRELHHFLVSSNAFFFIPLIISLYLGIYFHALSVLVCIIGSILYHQSKEKKMRLVDRYSATQLIFVNLTLLALGGFKWSYVLVIIIFIVLAFYFKWLADRKNYTAWHSMWHIMSALITVASILSYKSF